jgi:hypothetical protein
VKRQRRKPRPFTAAQSAALWDRWQKGEGLKSMGRVFDKTSSSIFAHIGPTGGIRPPARRRSVQSLTHGCQCEQRLLEADISNSSPRKLRFMYV